LGKRYLSPWETHALRPPGAQPSDVIDRANRRCLILLTHRPRGDLIRSPRLCFLDPSPPLEVSTLLVPSLKPLSALSLSLCPLRRGSPRAPTPCYCCTGAALHQFWGACRSCKVATPPNSASGDGGGAQVLEALFHSAAAAAPTGILYAPIVGWWCRRQGCCKQVGGDGVRWCYAAMTSLRCRCKACRRCNFPVPGASRRCHDARIGGAASTRNIFLCYNYSVNLHHRKYFFATTFSAVFCT
jgi:hypothetical protein